MANWSMISGSHDSATAAEIFPRFCPKIRRSLKRTQNILLQCSVFFISLKIVFVSKRSEMTTDKRRHNGNGRNEIAENFPQSITIPTTAAMKSQNFSHVLQKKSALIINTSFSKENSEPTYGIDK
jgi:hypothetical protein